MNSGDASPFDRSNYCPFIGDTATTAEGLRKLALNYKDTMQGRLDLEKYRSISKGAIKSFDPRFRRARNVPTCEASTKSETKVPSPFHQGKAMPTSLPMVSSMPSSPKRSPRKKNKCTIPRMRSQTLDKLQRGNSFIERIGRKGNDTVDTATWADLNPLHASKNVLCCDGQTETKDNNSIKMRSQVFSGDSMRVLESYTTPPIEIKPTNDEMMSKSVLTMPLETRDGVCANCSCDFVDQQSVNCNASAAGTNTIIQALAYVTDKQLKKVAESWYVVWGLYAFGCLCGLILVTSLAWIVSNDKLWHWVNPPKPPPLPKVSPFYAFIMNCGGSLIFTINLVVSTVYQIISLPRNSVFGSAEDEYNDGWV